MADDNSRLVKIAILGVLLVAGVFLYRYIANRPDIPTDPRSRAERLHRDVQAQAMQTPEVREIAETIRARTEAGEFGDDPTKHPEHMELADELDQLRDAAADRIIQSLPEAQQKLLREQLPSLFEEDAQAP